MSVRWPEGDGTEASDGDIVRGNKQCVEDATGPVAMTMNASGKGSIIENDIQGATGKRKER